MSASTLIAIWFWRFGIYQPARTPPSRVVVTHGAIIGTGEKFYDYRPLVGRLYFDIADWWPRDLYRFIFG